MDVDHHRQALIEDHLHGGVQVAEIVVWDTVGLAAAKHGLRIDAQANVVEVHGLDQRDVLSGVPGVEVLFGVALRVVNLGEPFAEVDAVAEVLGATGSQR